MGVCAVAEHVAGHHVAYAAVVVVLGDVERGVRCRAEAFCLVGDNLELFVGESAGVGDGGVYFITEVFGKVFDCE